MHPIILTNFSLILDESKYSNLQCIFNQVAGNLVITDGTRVGLRKDLSGIYLLKTALQAPVENSRDGEIFLEMMLPDVRLLLSHWKPSLLIVQITLAVYSKIVVSI